MIEAEHNTLPSQGGYFFSPNIEESGIIDYTKVEPDKIYLANRKTILDLNYPSYLPPVHIRRSAQYDIPAFKIKDNEYLIHESDEMRSDENGNLHNPRTYRVSLDVYAALVNYHLEFDRATFAAVAQRNEEERLRAVESGAKEYHAIREGSIPVLPDKLDVNLLPSTYTNKYLQIENKPSRVALKSTKSKRMSFEPYYFIRDMAIENGSKLSKAGIFGIHRECIDDVNQKLLDMELQKADFESSWTKGRETSYGDSNLDDSLLGEYGVRIKRQNGERINIKEIEQLKQAIEQVYSVYGDVSVVARNFGLKVSHAGNMRMHASKYAGLFSSYHNAIGVSFADGTNQASLTAVHEYAHFLDHLSGKEHNAWHSSDIPGSLENKIAIEFRGNMNTAKGEYWNRTCECFARAIEEYAQIAMIRESEGIDGFSLSSLENVNIKISRPANVNYSSFQKHIEPLVLKLLEQYKERFVTEKVIEVSVVGEKKTVTTAMNHETQEPSKEKAERKLENLQKQVYFLAVDKVKLDKEAKKIAEDILEERHKINNNEQSRISREIGKIEREHLSKSELNPELENDPLANNLLEQLYKEYNNIRHDPTHSSETLSRLLAREKELKTHLDNIEIEGRNVTRELEKEEEATEAKKNGKQNTIKKETSTMEIPQQTRATYAQLKLFEPVSEYNFQEHEFYSKLYDYFEEKVPFPAENLTLSIAPPLLEYIGIQNCQMHISISTLDDSQKINGLSKDEIEHTLRSISDPVLVYASQINEEKRYVLTTDTNSFDEQLGLFMLRDEKSNRLIIEGIRRIQGEEQQSWIENNLLLYFDDKRISKLQRRENVLFPRIKDRSFIKAFSEENIKTKYGFIAHMIAEHPEKNITEGDPAVTRNTIREAKAARRSYTDRILKGEKSGLWKTFREFKKHGVFDIQGASVATNEKGIITSNGWEQLYQALNIYRDKRFETFRVLFITPEGVIKDQLAISSYLPNLVNVSAINGELRDQITNYAMQSNTKIVVVHNHPSGNVASSIQDESLTKHLEEILIDSKGNSLLMGHIILDHDSFGLYESNTWQTVRSNTQGNDSLMKTRLPDFTYEKINSPIILKDIAKQINESDRWNSKDWVPILFTNGDARTSGIRYFSKEWIKNTPSEKIIEEFQTIGVKTGAIWAFPIISKDLAQDAELEHAIINHMKNGCFMDFCIAGKTADLYFLDEYRSGVFHTLSRDDVLARTTVESTFSFERQNSRANEESEAVASRGQEEYGGQTENGESLFRTHNSPGITTAIKNISMDDISKPNERILISEHVPFIFKECGLPGKSIEIYLDKIARGILLPMTERHGHNNSVNKENILEVFSQIANPRVIFRSKDSISLVAVYDVLDKKNEPIMLSLKNDSRIIETNLITSVYGKPTRDIEYWIDGERMLYVNDLEEKKAFMLPSRQLRMSNINAFNKLNIRTKSEFVNTNFVKSEQEEYTHKGGQKMADIKSNGEENKVSWLEDERNKSELRYEEQKKEFYKSMDIDPHAPLFDNGKSLADITITMQEPGRFVGEIDEYEVSADDVFYREFKFDTDYEEEGINPSTIHGIDELLNSSNFVFSEGTYEYLLRNAQGERERFLEKENVHEVQNNSDKNLWRANGVMVEMKRPRSRDWEFMVSTDDPEKTKVLVSQMIELEKEKGKAFPTKNELQDNSQIPEKKPYLQVNAEQFLNAVKEDTAPFLVKNAETEELSLLPKAIRSAETGKIFRGSNQLLAQVTLKEMGSKDTELITYVQAKKFEAGIRKQAQGLNLTTWNAETNKQAVYRYYPLSEAYNRDWLPKIVPQVNKAAITVVCTDQQPEKYLGKYLAATSLGVKFETNKKTMEGFKNNLVKDLEAAFSERRYTRVFEIGERAGEICRNTMSEIGTKKQVPKSIEKAAPKIIRNVPYNPVTGEKFVGINGKNAEYVMQKRQSKDPRFLELTDILKAGLSLKQEVKEPLVISVAGKSRFFYNAADIQDIPPRTKSIAQVPEVKVQKHHKEREMEL